MYQITQLRNYLFIMWFVRHGKSGRLVLYDMFGSQRRRCPLCDRNIFFFLEVYFLSQTLVCAGGYEKQKAAWAIFFFFSKSVGIVINAHKLKINNAHTANIEFLQQVHVSLRKCVQHNVSSA
jgi:hypothetical protein